MDTDVGRAQSVGVGVNPRGDDPQQIWRDPDCCQMAVTLAFITNSFALIEQRVAWSARPTGLDEANVFVIRASTEPHEVPRARGQRRICRRSRCGF